MKLLLSLVILATGLLPAWMELRWRLSAREEEKDDGSTSRSCGPLPASPRPWRTLAAGICAVTAVMFVLGIYILDETTPKRTFIVYWLIILLLVLWLLVLAAKDMLHTRRLLALVRHRQRERAEEALQQQREMHSTEHSE